MNNNYPELYYRIYPKVIDSINNFLGKNNNIMDISKEDIEKMVDEVYIRTVNECPEIASDPFERRSRKISYRLQRPFYSRKKLLMDIITIILLSELLRIRKSYGYGLGNYNQIY